MVPKLREIGPKTAAKSPFSRDSAVVVGPYRWALGPDNAVRTESERLGFLTADEVHGEMSGIIDKARRAKV